MEHPRDKVTVILYESRGGRLAVVEARQFRYDGDGYLRASIEGWEWLDGSTGAVRAYAIRDHILFSLVIGSRSQHEYLSVPVSGSHFDFPVAG